MKMTKLTTVEILFEIIEEERVGRGREYIK